MERIGIKVYTRNELVEIVAEGQREVERLENTKRTPFSDFRYEERKKHISKLDKDYSEEAANIRNDEADFTDCDIYYMQYVIFGEYVYG